jgi:Mn2+/Fe2+ NRAMP family transporter
MASRRPTPVDENAPVTRRKERAGGPATLEAAMVEERNPFKRFFLVLGPGLVTGASDDDPSGIGTYAVAGASFGFATLWTALISFPLMTAVINGVLAPPLLVIVMLIANNEKAMGEDRNGPITTALGWITVAVLSVAAIALFFTF